jgi:hypothetical protein
MDRVGLIGSTDSGGNSFLRGRRSSAGTRRRASTNRVIVLTCFGRGGSGIVWRMIGSSPDVIMTNDEWHVGVFGTRKALRKGVPLAFRSLGIESLEPLRRYAFRKTLEMQRPNDVAAKPDALSLVVKLMDYHIVFTQMIAASFERATIVNLTRHPYGLCESLMRSGLSLDEACRWYRDVALMMVKQTESGAITVGFEEVVTRPIETCDRLYRSLGVRWSEDGKFEFKIKPYGERRSEDVDVRHGEVLRIGAGDAGRCIDASVLSGERDRLSDHQRKAIWNLTGEMASCFGYDRYGSEQACDA